MSEKELKVRIQHKHDVEANWLKATNFIPLASEIIIYDQDENYDYPRIKIGDNKTNVNALPFVTKDYAKISDIPTKPADIGAQPAGNYLTSIPNEYVTEDELNSKGYLTNYTETDPTVPAWAKASTKPTYNKSEVGLSNVDNIQQYSANNPPVVVRASAPSDTNLLWIDPNENSLAYIPVKGIDFWTEADQESIVQQVIAALGTPVFGRVDAENNIILSGELADGTYTIKYEDVNGNVTIIGTLNHSNVPEPTYTNLIPLSINADGTPYNGGQGWKTGARLNSSGVESTSSATDVEVTGFIPVKAGDVIYLKNITMNILSEKANQTYFWLYDSNFTPLSDRYSLFSQYSGEYSIQYDISNKYVETDTGDINGNITMIKINDNASITYTNNGATKGDINNVAYFRISCEEINADSIITVNKSIVGGEDTGNNDNNEDSGSTEGMPDSGTIELVWSEGVKLDKNTGAEDSGTGYAASQHIELVDGYTYTFDQHKDADGSIYGGVNICYYDASGNGLGYELLWDAAAVVKSKELTPISGAKTFRVRLYYGEVLSSGCYSVVFEKTA